MRTISKALALVAVAVPVIVGGAGAAFADSGPVYTEQSNAATERGATEHSIVSGFLGGATNGGGGLLGGMAAGWSGDQQDTGPSYAETGRMAGPKGASSHVTSSGFDSDGDVYYAQGHKHAGPNGAGSTTVASRS